MGSFPFASIVGTMSNSFPETAMHGSSLASCRSGIVHRWCAPPSSSRLLSAGTSPTHNLASCFGTARCPDAGARSADIRGSVSRRTSGRTLTRSERGGGAVAERGPPSPWPPC